MRQQLFGLGFGFLKPARRHLHFEEGTLALLRDMTVSARWLLLRSMGRDDNGVSRLNIFAGFLMRGVGGVSS
jgi:hypothetical protein